MRLKITPIDGLLYVSMTLVFRNNFRQIDHLILDTGASHSVISMDLVEDMGIYGEPEDEIVVMHGIGGVERSIRKQVDALRFGTYRMSNVKLDFANFDEHFGINGLVGSDILVAGRFTIDLDTMELFQKHS